MKTTIEINGTEYQFKPTVRAMMKFEAYTGRTFGLTNNTDSFIYLFCILDANNPGMELDWEGFLDAIDNDPQIYGQLDRILREAAEMDALMMEESKKGEKEGESKKKRGSRTSTLS